MWNFIKMEKMKSKIWISVMISTLNVIKFLKNGMRNILLDILYNKNEWLLLKKKFQLLVFHGKNKLLSDEMMSSFYKTKRLSWIIIVPSHWNKSQQADINPLGQTFSDSWANRPLFLFLNTECLEASSKY